MTLFGALVRGGVAGAVGTLAMDLLWYARYRREGGESGFVEWESSAGLDNWANAPAPAQFGNACSRSSFDETCHRNTPGLLTMSPTGRPVWVGALRSGWLVARRRPDAPGTVWSSVPAYGRSRTRCWCRRSCTSRHGTTTR